MDGGRILKSVKTSYAEHVGDDKMDDIVREMMKQQHKAMFIALRDGKFDTDDRRRGGRSVAVDAGARGRVAGRAGRARRLGRRSRDRQAAAPRATGSPAAPAGSAARQPPPRRDSRRSDAPQTLRQAARES